MQGFFKLTLFSITLFACTNLFAQEVTTARDTIINGDTLINITKSSAGVKGVTVTGVIKEAATGRALPAVNVSVHGFICCAY